MARSKGTWTPEQARQMVVRSVASRRERAAQARYQTALGLTLNALPDYTDRTKARVRAQIELVLSQVDREAAKQSCDGAKLDRLASALERLSELERVLDNRPGPGTRRPPAESAPSARDNRVAAVPQLPVAPAPAAAAPPSASYVPTPQVSQPSPTTAHSKEDAQPRRLLTEPPEF